MLQSELAVRVTFNEADRPRLQEAIDVLNEIRDVLIKSGCDCNLEKDYLIGAAIVIKDILDGKTI